MSFGKILTKNQSLKTLGNNPQKTTPTLFEKNYQNLQASINT
jgi:hypothetical protein